MKWPDFDKIKVRLDAIRNLVTQVEDLIIKEIDRDSTEAVDELVKKVSINSETKGEQ